ncbi:hypothetical protein LEP1GSC121_2730 [Leptospira borgpetersenii serovar Castellonis str. 200801910]|uniref:Addiction module antidote protein HigA n=1 Tax=Leptospira borgpetersenii serovar Ballum TaxID=280505 RepID=A0A0S2ITT3_LEPBO|nr:addiction module antidote protein HigA [Leptospira borgpetersenii serovar Ballum]EKQ99254.1 hypothetical protein LEP1GSC121_2730 [Leptospira borgpetersenii serovar Castellonis str. 200801910]EMK12712.1 hypothetical protein LEP1GSC066_3685 [Leptospira sp. serovar Kenya str. Sh9]
MEPTPQFWLELQNDYDIEEEMLKKRKNSGRFIRFKRSLVV